MAEQQREKSDASVKGRRKSATALEIAAANAYNAPPALRRQSSDVTSRDPSPQGSRSGDRRRSSVQMEAYLSKYSANQSVANVAMQVARSEKQKHLRNPPRYYTCLIDPRTSPWIGWWDLILSLALLFTACLTPVEVGFMGIPTDRWRNPLFLVNRIVDCIFILDMGLQFVLMHPAEEGQIGGIGQAWVTDHKLIAKHYLLSSWFVLDFFSIGVSGLDIFSPEDSGVARLKALRALVRHLLPTPPSCPALPHPTPPPGKPGTRVAICTNDLSGQANGR